MASADCYFYFFLLIIYRILLGKDRGSRFYMGTQYDGGAVTDSTENTAGVICFFNNSAVTDFKVVIVFGTTAF